LKGIREDDAVVTRAQATDPMVPSYDGGKFPLSTYLAERVRKLLAEPETWKRLPDQVSDWLRLQAHFSVVPSPNEVLVETFPRGMRHYLVCYPFEGRLAHQSLGMLLTRRLERAGAGPLGFVANEYALAVWALNDMGEMVRDGRLDLAKLFDADMLGDDLDAWLAESSLMKRSFRICAIISGLIERRHPGQEKTGRQMTVSSDLIYDVLRQHEPDHVLLHAAFADAATGLIDVGRLNLFLERISGRIRHIGLSQVSPLAVPVMLEIGRESVPGEASETLLRETVEELIAEALSGHAARQA
jgi:ATP-dependent Lhr-like helicase